MTTLKKVYNLREEGDDTCASVYVHKNGDIPNSQCVRVELIEVSDDYFSLDENLNLPSEVRSDAHFKQVNKDVDGKKAAGGDKRPTGKGKQGVGKVKRLLLGVTRVLVEETRLLVGVRGLNIIFFNVSGSFLVSPSLPEDDIEDGYVNE